jgi:hypothetical protein
MPLSWRPKRDALKGRTGGHRQPTREH